MELAQRFISVRAVKLFKPQTLYNWRHLGKYPEIFVKIGGRVFVDKEKLLEVMSPKK